MEPFKSIQIKFIKELYNNIDKVCKKIEANKDEAILYAKNLN